MIPVGNHILLLLLGNLLAVPEHNAELYPVLLDEREEQVHHLLVFLQIGY